MSLPTVFAIATAAWIAGALISRYWSRRQLQRTHLASLVFDNTGLGIVVTDPYARIVAVNPAYCRMSGFEASELVGRNPSIQKAVGTTKPSIETCGERLNPTGNGRVKYGIAVKMGRPTPRGRTSVQSRTVTAAPCSFWPWCPTSRQ